MLTWIKKCLCNLKKRVSLLENESDSITTTSDIVDKSMFIKSTLSPVDIHNNGTVAQFSGDARVDTGRARDGNVMTYTGSPDHVDVVVSINAEDSGASNYRSRPKLRILKGGAIVAVFDDLVMQQNGAYDGDGTITGTHVDANPGVNPSYTYEWFDEENRTATLVPNGFSSITAKAVEKISVITSIAS